MKKLLSPKNDVVFKMLFTRNTEVLADLINSVLERSDKNRIISVEIQNPDILPDEIEKKFIILDIRAVDESGHEYDIEMQVRRYENYSRRTLYYLCRMYGNQLKSGDDYLELHPVIGIHFLDYTLFPDAPDFHYSFRFSDIRYPDLTLTDDLNLHIFELPGIEQYFEAQRTYDLLEWLHFFNHASEEGERTMKEHYKNPMIHKALDVLQALSADEKTRELAERREKALKDESMFMKEAQKRGMEEGIAAGRTKEKKETAIRLLKLNLLSMEKIAAVTGLDMKEVEALKQTISGSQS